MNAEQQSERDKSEVKIMKVDNGYIIKSYPHWYVFKSFEEVTVFLDTVFNKKLERPKQEFGQ